MKVRSSSVSLVFGFVLGTLVSVFASAFAWTLAQGRVTGIATSGIVLVLGVVVGAALMARLIARLRPSMLESPHEGLLQSVVVRTWLEALQLAKRYPDRDTLLGELRRRMVEENDKVQDKIIDVDDVD